MKLVLLSLFLILFLLGGCTPTNENLTELTGNPNSTTVISNNNNPASIGNQAFTFIPSSYDFGNKAINTAATTAAITVKNTSEQPIYISSIGGVSAPFTIASDNCPRSPTAVAVSATCTVNVTFQPTGGGLFNKTLAVNYGPTTANTTIYSAVMGISGSGVGTLSFAGISSITNIYSTQLQLNWTHVAGALTYFVIKVNGDGTSTLVANVTPPTASYIVPGLTANTAYQFWVRASDTLGALDTNTNIVSTSTNNTPPTPDIPVITDYVYPSTAITVGNSLSYDTDEWRTGVATDTAITYSCYYDTAVDGVVATTTNLCTNLGSSLSFSTTSGILLWTPTSSAIGFYEVKIKATDNNSALFDTSIFKVNVVPAYASTNLKTSLMAPFANITYNQTGSATLWEDVTTNGNDGTLESFAFLGSDGWFGAGTIASPYRLVLDGTGRVDLGTILNGNTKFATAQWLIPSATTAGISALYQSSALDVRMDDSGSGRFQVNFGQTYRDTIMSQSPIAYYEFNETSGTTMTDSSGNGYHGTYVNGAAYLQTNCPLNGNNKNACVDFDGVNDYASVSYAAINAVFNPGNSFSFSLWYYPEEIPTGAWHDLFDRAYTSHISPWYNVTLRMNSTGLIQGVLWNSVAGTYLSRNSASSLSLHQWYHIAVVVNLSAPSYELFINGVSQGSSSATSGTYVNHGSPLTIGTNKNLIGASYSSDGKMDDVAIFNTALSGAQVLAQYNAGINYNNGAGLYPYNAVMQDRPVAFYRLGESSGSVAYDSSGNGHHGQYQGAYTQSVVGSYNPTDSNTAVTFSASGYIRVLNQTPFNFTGAFSLEAWVKGTDMSGWWHAVSRWGANNTMQRYGIFTDTSGYPYFGILKSNTGYSVGGNIAGNSNVLNGSWHHIVGTNDGSVLKIYVDGAFVTASAIGWGGATDTDSVYLMLGASPNGSTGNQMLPNSLDEVAIYNYALTNSQVKAHYTQSSYNFCKLNKSYLANEAEFLSTLYDGTYLTVFAKNIEQCKFRPTSSYTPTPNLVLGSRSDTSQSSPWVGSVMDTKIYASSDGTAASSAAGIQAIYDNTEVKYKSRPDAVTTPLFWYRPEEFISSTHLTAISSWPDRSGNNYHMTNSGGAGTKPTVIARAVNNYPALFFNAGQNFDFSSQISDSSTSHTIFIVHYPNDAGGFLGYFMHFNGGTLIVGDHTGVSSNNGFYSSGTWNHFTLQSGWQVQTWVFDGAGSNGKVYVNGTLTLNAAYTPVTLSGTHNFGVNNASAQYLRAQVSEVVGYSGALSTTQQQAVECYLARKFNIALSFTCSGN